MKSVFASSLILSTLVALLMNSLHGSPLCIQLISDASAQDPKPAVVVLHDEDLNGVPDEVGATDSGLSGAMICNTEDSTCGLAVAMARLPVNSRVSLRATKKCPTRKVKRLVTRAGVFVRQNVSSLAKKKCKKPAKKPTATPTKTPATGATATPSGGGPLPAPSPDPTNTPLPIATATPVRPATPTATPTSSGGSGGNAAVGKSFYTQACTSCHGVKGGKSEQQVLAAMSSISDHSSVRALVSSQTAKDIAAYLATAR